MNKIVYSCVALDEMFTNERYYVFLRNERDKKNIEIYTLSNDSIRVYLVNLSGYNGITMEVIFPIEFQFE